MPGARKHIFEQAIRQAEILHHFFGTKCEVAVHDFSNKEATLIHLSGKLPGKEISSRTMDLILSELNKPPEEVFDIPSVITKLQNGYILKSAISFLRDAKGNVIGALCINYDITELSKMAAQLNDFVEPTPPAQTKENMYSTVHEMIEEMIRKVIEEFNKPLHTFTMEEKIDVVRILEEKGAFLMRGSTDYLAMELGVSKFTIYNYLQRIRVQNEFKTDL